MEIECGNINQIRDASVNEPNQCFKDNLWSFESNNFVQTDRKDCTNGIIYKLDQNLWGVQYDFVVTKDGKTPRDVLLVSDDCNYHYIVGKAKEWYLNNINQKYSFYGAPISNAVLGAVRYLIN